MTIGPGTRLGLYEILSPLGAGGMGEVYRARDTKLRREVAIKFLAESFAHDEQRLARFEREARLLAAINHPHIATLYGLEESDDVHFLVMELVEGETLAEKIPAGGLSTDDALPIFKQIAEALVAAHEKGVIHRDLKPANIKVTPDGNVKVLDFGLAKAFTDETPQADLSDSPTLTREATRAGVIMGTAAYMSPEQARGKDVDKRTDLWAFGCCLYEALTGRKAFQGETVTDTLAAIVHKEPEWSRLPAGTPWRVRDLLMRSLRKDMSLRLTDAAALRLDIEDTLREPQTAPEPGITVAPSRRWKWLAAVAVASLATGVTVWQLGRPEPPAVKRFEIHMTPLQALTEFALSPDGATLVHVGADDRLYARKLDELDASPISGTEGAGYPFFSPDGQWIGFHANGKIKKVQLVGGPPLTVCDTRDLRGAVWAPDDTIVYTPAGGRLTRVPSSGGTPTELTEPNRKAQERDHRWPHVLPGSTAILYTVWTQSPENAKVAVYSDESKQSRLLIESGTDARCVPTGHLLFVREQVLMAAPFDLKRLEVTGTAVPLIDNLAVDLSGHAGFTVSRDGTLIYQTGRLQPDDALVWVDRDGVSRPAMEEKRIIREIRLSPDGTRVALSCIETPTGRMDIWIVELGRGAMTRLTYDGRNLFPVWTADGGEVTFSSNREGPFNIYSKPADGSGEAKRLTNYEADARPMSWSPDGERLLFLRWTPEQFFDIWVLSPEGEAQPLIAMEFDERYPQFSRDGQWIAYTSNETGQREVYVTASDGKGSRTRISNDGGTAPVWSRDGKELFYRSGDKMMVVSYETSPEFTPSKPVALFDRTYETNQRTALYDVSLQGREFLMARSDKEASLGGTYVVLNWFEELKRLVPSR